MNTREKRDMRRELYIRMVCATVPTGDPEREEVKCRSLWEYADRAVAVYEASEHERQLMGEEVLP